ncbi:hypothetical protein B0I35DRAFT_206301 [Stachybotrys elegans]|uniref:Chromatin modification-related protein n=1 Tax=Stachybotrys elegans TaxID=80388 RepID=A0A8K0SYF6_9HYPO|nr:hypothetical protein B0I35DRAFT_206301 [Stachybotrys elegans]
MKSAKQPPAPEPASQAQRRSQPLRQTRTNPPRSSANTTRPNGGRDSLGSAPVGDQPIDIFPAITHFADAMTALPKELVRHFTLLKEVDAKIFAPEEQLFKLVATATNMPIPTVDRHNSTAPTSAPMSTQNSSTGHMFVPGPSSVPSVDGGPGSHSAPYDPSNLHRRQHFRQTAFKIQEMLVALEEKNHVISTANDALSRQLARIDDVWPAVEGEFSDEAKWGSTTHWAYPENRTGRFSNAERARRDGAAVISAAAQALVDEAAARSDARKQAVQAKKSLKNQHQEGDGEDGAKGEGNKKSSSKARKAAESSAVGLGISTTGAVNGNPPTKRRKVEKVVNGAAPTERAMASVFGNNTAKAKPSSPQATPAPETKKRKALPSSSGQSKKKTAPAAQPASAATSPVLTALPEPKAPVQASPAPPAAAATPTAAAPPPTTKTTTPTIPAATPRPASSRARQNSIQSNADGTKAKAPVVSAKPNGNTSASAPATPDLAASNPPPRPGPEVKPLKEAPAPPKAEPIKSEAERPESSAPPAAPMLTRKESKPEEVENKAESAPPVPQSVPMVMTKSGRASKPSTPALATFQEAAAAAARPRSSRNTEGGSTHKKGHRKSSSVVVQQPLPMAAPVEASNNANGDDDEGEGDADELTYCYCNGVSYGEMVACDAPGCQREWFHLACVGLRVAPGSKTKWYCEDCKERLKLGNKKVNGR